MKTIFEKLFEISVGVLITKKSILLIYLLHTSCSNINDILMLYLNVTIIVYFVRITTH